MKKKGLLSVLGILPLLIGFIMNLLILRTDFSPGFFLEGILLGVWGLLGYKLCRNKDHLLKNTIFIHIPAFFFLLLLLFQELVVGRFWLNFIGSAAQFFYLPALVPARMIISPFRHFQATAMWPAFLAEFILLFFASWFGGWLKSRRT